MIGQQNGSTSRSRKGKSTLKNANLDFFVQKQRKTWRLRTSLHTHKRLTDKPIYISVEGGGCFCISREKAIMKAHERRSWAADQPSRTIPKMLCYAKLQQRRNEFRLVISPFADLWLTLHPNYSNTTRKLQPHTWKL